MITVDRLTKTYGQFRAVDDVSFVCQQGRVTGFLGPNGAGKTTTMRVMVGLTPATERPRHHRRPRLRAIPNPGRHVGVLLDASAQHGGRTGREILSLGALAMGLPSSRVDEMLELVGLTDAEAKRRMRNYSLGMKQRLGIAHALLGDPEVLILDEPANGLDPAGIRWMRGLLKCYADRGGTVLLSSHLLNEVELIADEMILIGHGRIVAQGDKKSLLAGAQGAATALVMSLDNAGLATELARRGHLVDPMGDGLKVTRLDRGGRARRARSRDRADRPTHRGRRPGGPVPRADLGHGTGGRGRRTSAATAASHGAHVPNVASMPPVDSPLTPPGGHR